MMKIDFPTQTIFYTIEKAIKQYRKMSQKEIARQVENITIDQVLILLLLDENPEYSQVEIAELLFKDYASVTRMVELMVTNGYLSREGKKSDKRRASLVITEKGRESITHLIPIINANREKALKGINLDELAQVNTVLQRLIRNCS